MRHEDDGFCAMFTSIFDGGKGTDNALIVRDLCAIEGDIEVNLNNEKSVRVSIDGITENSFINTRISTCLSLRSTSVIASFLERDMMRGPTRGLGGVVFQRCPFDVVVGQLRLPSGVDRYAEEVAQSSLLEVLVRKGLATTTYYILLKFIDIHTHWTFSHGRI